MCSPWGGTVTFTQQGKQASSNSTCVDVNRALLKDLMNRKFDLFPGATPMYTISSDLGAILLACTSSGRCIYAVHPKTCRCAMSSCDPCRTSKGVHQLWWWSGVQLYTWVAWAIKNSHQLSGMQASWHIASDLSITVHMNHSAWPFVEECGEHSGECESPVPWALSRKLWICTLPQHWTFTVQPVF